MRLIVFILTALVTNCGIDDSCPRWNYYNQFNYKTNFNQTTPIGIKVDTSGQDMSLVLIDELTLKVEDCLNKNFPDGKIPDDVYKAGQCSTKTLELPCDKDCLKVKIPNDWLWSCDGTQQLLPSQAPKALCEAKGLHPTAECPCRWRAGIQDDSIIVATPNLHLYKDPLIRYITGCNNPWFHPKLAECANP